MINPWPLFNPLLPEEKPSPCDVAPWTDIQYKGAIFTSYYDQYPVANGHLLFVPRYNTVNCLSDAFLAAVKHGKFMVESGDCDGFNIGMNYCECAGQTVDWPHIHLIPRFSGDVEDPVGGVRNVIPGKGNYRNQKMP